MKHSAQHPLLITLRLASGLPNLRRAREFAAIRGSIWKCAFRPRFRLVHFCVLSNHLHFVVEASDQRSLSRGMQRLGISLAKQLNGVWKRRGAVFGDTFHARALRSPAETRHALGYVLHNARRHGIPVLGWDPYSSAANLRSWIEPVPVLLGAHPAAGVVPARTWLLRIGWTRRGGLRADEVPAARRRAEGERVDRRGKRGLGSRASAQVGQGARNAGSRRA